MKYVKAIDVLPQEIIEIIQNYVDGEYLYIPRKNDNKKSWGEKSGIKNITDTTLIFIGILFIFAFASNTLFCLM